MDEQERRRRLRTYGYAAAREPDQPSPVEASNQDDEGSRAALADRDAVAVSDSVAASMAELGAGPVPGVWTRILDSLAFRYGLIVTSLGLVAGLLWVTEMLPPGPLETAAVSLVGLTLTPAAVTTWMAVGVLAPPAPFRSGLLLGLYSAVLMAVVMLVGSVETGGIGLAELLVLALASAVVAALVVGIVGWVIRRLLMGPEARRPFRDRPALEPRERPRPSLVIAVTLTCLPLLAFATESTEWVFLAAYGALMTGAMIRWGLDVQRRYPERRTPVVVVGLVAGVVAGLAMLQAIWSQGRWPDRRASSDRLAIGVAVVLVVAAAYLASGTAESLSEAQAFSVRPRAGQTATGTQVAAMQDVLAERLSTLGIAAELHADGSHIRVLVPADEDPLLVRSVLTSESALAFVPVPRSCSAHVIEGEPAPACLRLTRPLFDGARVVDARTARDQVSGEIVVLLELDEVGAGLFDEHAAAHRGERFAVVLYGLVRSAPTLDATAYGGRAQISGDFSLDEASALVTALHGGHDLPYATVAVGPWPPSSPQA